MTPPHIAEKMVNFMRRPISEWRVIDPACGDGNLLLAIVEKMKYVGLDAIADRIAGIDIDSKMVDIARQRVAEQLSCKIEDIRIFQGDFFQMSEPKLFDDLGLSLDDFNTVISNPPYGQSKEYKFFERCADLLPDGSELVFLMPLAFIDRVNSVTNVPLEGRPLGVTTGHTIVHHIAGQKFELRPIKEYQHNSSNFKVLSGVKLYELGAGTPVQTEEIVRTKPYSSSNPRPGWLPCLRTGDIHPYTYSTNRLYVHYGKHLAHPKELARFQGSKIFVRRVPIWKMRQLAAVYLVQTILCAGDILVIKHCDDNEELLKGLCVFLNSEDAAKIIFHRRPSVLYRDSYPKLSAKDINALLETSQISDEKLRLLAQDYPLADVVNGSSGEP